MFFSRLRQLAQHLTPAYFGMVMATGIVSIGAHLAGMDGLSETLFELNRFVYITLALLLLARLLFFFSGFVTELTSHTSGPAFFTTVAGSSVLGVQYVLLDKATGHALLLLTIALVMWIALVYTFFVGVIVVPEKPTLEKGLNGSWLLLVVSTQSVVVLGTLLMPHLPFTASAVLFSALGGFLLGFVFYLILITLILYRLLFLPEKADAFTPPYWIDMGAVAITTLAGATLTEAIQTTVGTGLADLIPFIKGISILAWATATWWLPLITLLEIWRHGFKKVPLAYSPQYWSLVFPLGMYMVGTWRLSEALRMPFLQPLARLFIYIALVVWAITFLAMCVQAVRSFRQKPAH